MRDDPFLRVAAAALALRSPHAAEATPLADGKFGLTEDLSNFGHRVPFLDFPLTHEPIEKRLYTLQTFENLFGHDMSPVLSSMLLVNPASCD